VYRRNGCHHIGLCGHNIPAAGYGYSAVMINGCGYSAVMIN
jgi:hypothetical protein